MSPMLVLSLVGAVFAAPLSESAYVAAGMPDSAGPWGAAEYAAAAAALEAMDPAELPTVDTPHFTPPRDTLRTSCWAGPTTCARRSPRPSPLHRPKSSGSTGKPRSTGTRWPTRPLALAEHVVRSMVQTVENLELYGATLPPEQRSSAAIVDAERRIETGYTERSRPAAHRVCRATTWHEADFHRGRPDHLHRSAAPPRTPGRRRAPDRAAARHRRDGTRSSRKARTVRHSHRSPRPPARPRRCPRCSWLVYCSLPKSHRRAVGTSGAWAALSTPSRRAPSPTSRTLATSILLVDDGLASGHDVADVEAVGDATIGLGKALKAYKAAEAEGLPVASASDGPPRRHAPQPGPRVAGNRRDGDQVRRSPQGFPAVRQGLATSTREKLEAALLRMAEADIGGRWARSCCTSPSPTWGLGLAQRADPGVGGEPRGPVRLEIREVVEQFMASIGDDVGTNVAGARRPRPLSPERRALTSRHDTVPPAALPVPLSGPSQFRRFVNPGRHRDH